MVGNDTVTIPRSREEVFDVLVDGAQSVHWRRRVVDAERLSGDGGVGTQWQMEVSGLRRRLRGYVVETYEWPSSFAIRFTGGRSRSVATYTLTSTDDGTEVALHIAARGVGPFRFVGGAVPREMSSDLDDLQRLREYMLREPQDAAASPS